MLHRMDTSAPKALVSRFWDTLYARDWHNLAAYFGPESEYTDVPSPPDDVARGPAQIVARLRLGLEPIASYEHELRWWDYWDLQTLMQAAPAWWIEHIMAGYT